MSYATQVKKLEAVQAMIVRAQGQVAAWDVPRVTMTELKMASSDLKEFKDKLILLHEAIVQTGSVDEVKAQEPTFDTLFDGLKTVQVKVGELIATRESAAAKKAPSPSFKLERIKLPQFSGDLSEWQSFRDLFTSSVDKNPTLSGAEKMIHLKSSLVGDASAIVSSFQATDANYKQAWDLVVKRYSNQREMAFAHIRKLDDLKTEKEESSSGLRLVSDTVNELVRSLKNLTVPVEHWDIILIFIALKKLSGETRKQWLLSQKGSLPLLAQFLEYLESRARALADSEQPTTKSKGSAGARNNSKTSSHAASSSGQACVKCSDPHPLHKCKLFANANVSERRKLVSEKQLCFNCMHSGHSAAKCRIDFSCKKCGRRHHTLLHTEPSGQNQPPPPSNNVKTEETPSVEQASVIASHSTPLTAHSSRSGNLVLMGTFLGVVDDSTGVPRQCRVFLDPGSESNFVTEFCVDRLGLKRKKTCVNVTGISGSAGETSTGLVTFTLSSLVCDFRLEVRALILSKITNKLPRAACTNNWKHLEGLQLADPTYYTPGHVDILLGAGDAASIMTSGIKRGPSGTPTAQNSKFGWILSGIVSTASSSHMQIHSHHSSCSILSPCLDSLMRKFWELEEPEGQGALLTEEDGACEAHFAKTHIRESGGSYMVELPFKKNMPTLGNSREAAVKRFTRVERRLSSQPEVKQEYIRCMREAISSNFMEIIPPGELIKPTGESYYFPHREVVKEASSTTKVRIVMDASANTTTGVSLNDVLMTGPKLQADLVPLLINFRSYPVAMSADIVKFYPQFKVNPKHVDFQRLVWRENPDQPLQDYRMLRVTFGVTSAPFLAIRCLHQLAEDESDSFPLAASVIKNSFLVDNLLCGAEDVQQALLLQNEIRKVMERRNLKLRQWASNNFQIVQAVPPEERESNFPLSIQEDEAIKTIGILWHPVGDTFGVKACSPVDPATITKRSVLSSIAKTFDPLGWLSPITVRPKILMQELWRIKLEWDSELPFNLAKQWKDYCEDLLKIHSFRLPRCIVGPVGGSDVSYELHGFSDASLSAYAACVYVRTVSPSGNTIRLVVSKTKVAPLKQETIPRLELCGAVLLARLIKTVRNSLRLSFRVIRAWTDSTIVLDWLNSKNKLPVFVNNRIHTINGLIHRDLWFHVDGDENPADVPCRGITTNKMMSSDSWMNGRSWLLSSDFPPSAPESESVHSTTISILPVTTFIARCSSYQRMIRVMAYVHRFVKICRKGQPVGPLTTKELSLALKTIVGIVQSESFPKEIESCKLSLCVKSHVKLLFPFVDNDGLLRVGGRLGHSSLSLDRQHPLLLPRDHNFTEVMVRYHHIIHLHAGPQFLLSITREKYWIPRGRDVMKKIVRKCVECHRQNPTTTQQIMGQLPASRVNPSRPFSKSGMDFAGPFTLCLIRGRKPKLIKSYVCLFICIATKAIHLELVGDLTTESFIAALSRFIARRGLPSDLYCDGGKNFVGAKNEMTAFLKFLNTPSNQTNVHDFLSTKGINYHFNPPLAPHQGGLWEAGVKSMKSHLKRVIGDTHLSLEEFSTLLCQVEACLNSRPLTQMSSRPDDFEVLTPGHFLMGEAPLAHPQHDLTDLNSNRLSRWQLVQKMFQHIWRRWSRDYLHELQSRPKWFVPQPNLEVGMLVLIRDDEPSWGLLKWKLGRVAAVYPGQDGKVRVCDVRTAAGPVYKRPVVKLSPLPIYD